MKPTRCATPPLVLLFSLGLVSACSTGMTSGGQRDARADASGDATASDANRPDGAALDSSSNDVLAVDGARGDVLNDTFSDRVPINETGSRDGGGDVLNDTFSDRVPIDEAGSRDAGGDVPGDRMTFDEVGCPIPEERFCEGACRDIFNDPANCGGCGRACARGQTCRGGVCSSGPIDCAPGLTNCSGICVSLQTDAANCGACGNRCAADASCREGRCSTGPVLCGRPTVDCGGVCVNLQTDVRNCGACANACRDGMVCNAGRCETGMSSDIPCRTNAECDRGIALPMYCASRDGTCIGADSTVTGVCARRPDCTMIDPVPSPVCGCDGRTYGSTCEANAAGVNVRARGACAASDM